MTTHSSPAHRRWLPSSLLIVAVLALAGCDGPGGGTPAEHMQRARGYQSKGDLAAAVLELKNAIQKNPGLAEARFFLGEIYVEAGDGVAAEKELTRSAELGAEPGRLAVPLTRAQLQQGNLQAIVNDAVAEQAGARGPVEMPPSARAELLALRGHAYLGLAKPEVAEGLYDEALSLFADAPEAGIGKAALASRRGDVDGARERLQAVTSAHPDYATAWKALGDLERASRRLAEAEQAYSEAVKHAFYNRRERLERALVRLALDDQRGAREDLEQLQKGWPQHSSTQYLAGVIALADGRNADARLALQAAVKANPSNIPAVLALGVAHVRLEQYEQAGQHLQAYLSAVPRNAEAARLLASVRLRQKDYAGAEAVLRSLYARSSADTETLDLLASAVMPQGRRAEAIGYLDRVAEQSQSAEAYTRLGAALLSDPERVDAGLDALETAIEKDPELERADVALIMGYLASKQYPQALEAARRYQEKAPDSPVAHNFIGVAALALGDEATARAAFEAALRLAPGHPTAANNLAQLELKAGNVDLARAQYQAVLARSPDHLRTLMALAKLEAGQQQEPAAVALLERAAAAHPDALDPRLVLADYRLRSGDAHEALKLLAGLEARHPKSVGLLYTLGRAQLASGHAAQAVDTFERLVSVSGGNADARYLLATALAVGADEPAAIRMLRELRTQDPNHLAAKLLLAELLLRANQLEEAGSLLAEVRQGVPDTPVLLALEGELALRRGQPGQAVSAYQALLKASPQAQWALALASAQWRAGARDEATGTLETWLAEHPDDLGVRYALANNYTLRGEPDRAREAYEAVLKDRPEHVLALNNLAWLLRETDPARALAYAERAAGLAPESASVLDTLGWILVAQGKADQGLPLLRRAAQDPAAGPEVRYHLAGALTHVGQPAEAQEILHNLLASPAAFEGREAAEALLKELRGGGGQSAR